MIKLIKQSTDATGKVWPSGSLIHSGMDGWPEHRIVRHVHKGYAEIIPEGVSEVKPDPKMSEPSKGRKRDKTHTLDGPSAGLTGIIDSAISKLRG